MERWIFLYGLPSKPGISVSTWPLRSPVSLSSPWPKNFVVFDALGPHFVSIDYCDCGNQPLSTWHQLLHERWFPATLSCPQTVFTFDCLETFHELNLQGKTNLYDYYHTLLRRSDNANLLNPIVRFWKSFFFFCFSLIFVLVVSVPWVPSHV